MTRGSIREYVEAVRPRYLKASKAERTRMLDEFCQSTGYHRKSAVRVLRQLPAKAPKPPGRPRQYGQLSLIL